MDAIDRLLEADDVVDRARRALLAVSTRELSEGDAEDLRSYAEDLEEMHRRIQARIAELDAQALEEAEMVGALAEGGTQ